MKYTVKYERDESGWWIASIRSVPGCHTQGKTLEQARTRIREALGLFVKGAATAQLVDDVKLPSDVLRQVRVQLKRRKKAAAEQERAQESLRRAALRLTKDLHLSVRDAGELLQLSHQRVQQLVGG